MVGKERDGRERALPFESKRGGYFTRKKTIVTILFFFSSSSFLRKEKGETASFDLCSSPCVLETQYAS